MSQQAFVEFYEQYLNTPEGAELRDRIDAVTDPEAFCAAAADDGQVTFGLRSSSAPRGRSLGDLTRDLQSVVNREPGSL